MTSARPAARGRSAARALAATAVVAATAGSLLTVAAPTSAAAVDCASPVYKRQFFANTTFSGTPKQTDCDAAVDHDWGTGAPAAGLPSNYFGVRWTVTRDFGSGGPFSFPVAAQDGLRVYLDGVRKVDLWKNVSATQAKTVDLDIPAGKHSLRIDFVNWTGAANVKFGYVPRTSGSDDTTAPLAPTGFTATYDNDSRKAHLAWDPNKEMDLGGYQVYRRTGDAADWTTISGSDPFTGTTFTDAPPATGETYHYRIRAFDQAGNGSPNSAEQQVVSLNSGPGTPTGLTATGTTGGNTLRWQPSSGPVDHYEIWKVSDGPQDPDDPRISESPAYTDAGARQGVPVSYRVRAVDAQGRVSPYSETVTATRPDPGQSPTPSGVTAWYTDGVNHLSWDGGGYPNASSIRVYRLGPNDDTWTLAGETSAWSDGYDDPGWFHARYYVVTVDDWGKESNPAYTGT
ncbi:fibronectin type III domain-containing protein [Streptomyces sp. NBC_01304]|uniref:fibronectin type III domain-containing protein n=1 Tax=Streptomyces sp. NBC_01304 TaxID=2903818 RepID=UPI002E0F39C7|nr:PA14 domain-containing protein [Streptomyces sp. NBC_01304]